MAEYVTKQDIESLLSEQTKVILGAVDEQFEGVYEQFRKAYEQFGRIDGKLQAMDSHIGELEMRMDTFDEKLGVEILIQGR